MPVHRSGPRVPPTYPELVRAIADELRRDSADSQEANSPDIYIEDHQGRLHIHVLWDEWENIPDEDRLSVILEAFGESGWTDEASRIAMAIGLTHDEASALGIRFDTA